MITTTNYKLKKPASTDFYNIEDFNSNSDIIDIGLAKKTNKPTVSVAGNLPVFTVDGNLSDSGKNTGSFLAVGTTPAAIGAEVKGAAATVQTNLASHINDTQKHFTAAEKTKLGIAYTTENIVVSSTQPTAVQNRIWIKII